MLTVKKVSLSIVRWVLGIFFALAVLVEFSEGAIISAISALFLTVLLIPPLSRFTYSKIKQPIPTLAKVVVGVLFFFLMVGTATGSNKPEQTSIEPSPTSMQNFVGSQPTSSPQPIPSPEASPSLTPIPTIQPSPSPSPTPTLKPSPKTVLPTPSITPRAAPTNNLTGGKSCAGPDLDCADFSSHSEAQAFFNGCGFSTTNDPMKLDSVGVGDGVACESLP